MLSAEEHLDNLVRHIDLVRNACLLLGKRLMARGEKEFGRLVIAAGFCHDQSKFFGIEWNYLHAGKDVPKDKLEQAVEQHVETNQHHPEYWGGIEHAPRLAVAEMIADWYARSQEFGTSLRDWIKNQAIERYKIDTKGQVYAWMNDFVNILLEDSFVR
jgi:hypothetical protein